MPDAPQQWISVKRPILLRNDPYIDWEGERMEFRLTYEGVLLGSNTSYQWASHKHDIRKKFHFQLKRLWEINPHLLEDREAGPLDSGTISFGGPGPTRIERLASNYGCENYRLVPLVTEELELACGLDILMLRPDKPGSLIQSGDIDNRLKTLFDSLRIPTNKSELAGTSPEEGESPLFCLLQDDRLISRLTLSTDLLLEPVNGRSSIDANDVRLIITVSLRPTKKN